jgi:hypothetical protein
MTTVFISYRRDDSSGYAGRLYDRLVACYGEAAIFMDYYDLAPGADFPKAIDSDLAQSDVVLAVIGPRWIDARNADGSLRLGHQGDFVSRELMGALEKHKQVIPVLVGGASMPSASQLPLQLQALASLQAWEIRDARFDDDMKALLEFLPAATPMPAQPAVVSLAGDWVASVEYPWHESATERFHFELDGKELFGYGTFLTGKHPLEQVELLDDGARFVMHSESSMGSETRRVTHTYRVRVEENELQMRLQSTGGFDDTPPLKFTARRT